ncbi:MAG: hypothetical protein U0350_21335 [Caldilineaceae bacterium]
MKIILSRLLRLLITIIILLSIPLGVLSYWTLFLPGHDDHSLEAQRANLLTSLEFSADQPRQPIILVHGLWAANADGKSACAAKDGPFSQEALILDKRFVPLGQLGEWLRADGYEPYYMILATSPDYTASLADNGHCMEQQLRNLKERLQSKPGVKYTVIGHSMGGLVTRACLAQSEFCRSMIDRVITLGTPHNGAAGFYALKTGRKDCAADPGFCEMADQARIKAFNAQAPNLPGIYYTFIGGTWGLLDRAVHFLEENDGVVNAWSAIGMITNPQGQPEFADWVKPNPPAIYFVNNKHIISRRSGYAYYEAPALRQKSEAYACIRYALGKLAERPAVCRIPAQSAPAP